MINAVMLERIQARVAKVTVIDLSAPSLNRDWHARLLRLPKVVRGFWHFLRSSRRSSPLYISISGGAGQIYEILFVVAARLSRMRCFLHHHSYSYLNQRQLLAKTLIYVAGAKAVHICLSQGMLDRLKRAYKSVHKVAVVSNLAMLPWDSRRVEPRQSLCTIGFFGNISSEKGIYDFLDVVSALDQRAFGLRSKIAGPFQDKETERRVRERMRHLHSLEYVGPKYGAEKEVFLKELDVLLFPTSYANEAEPITVHEAMMHATPVVAYNRGAISEIITPASGLVVDTADNFVEAALKQIERWSSMPGSFSGASLAALEQSANLRLRSVTDCDALLNEICGDGSA
jgi:glycosyltransferase involved in cell wall biosynthesis